MSAEALAAQLKPSVPGNAVAVSLSVAGERSAVQQPFLYFWIAGVACRISPLQRHQELWHCPSRGSGMLPSVAYHQTVLSQCLLLADAIFSNGTRATSIAITAAIAAGDIGTATAQTTAIAQGLTGGSSTTCQAVANNLPNGAPVALCILMSAVSNNFMMTLFQDESLLHLT